MAQSSKSWYKSAYHRNVVDMHITDADESFLGQLDVENYVQLLKKSKSESAVVYAHSHVGFSYYDAADGSRHPLLRDPDFLQSLIKACHRENIGVVLYVSLIFDNWAFERHPDWRVLNAKGEEELVGERAKVCCPNSGYRDFVAAKARDLVRRYDVEGIRFDMTYWPSVCYCAHCRAKLLAEEGFEPPTTIDWFDPQWVAFQRARERWLAEFAGLATEAVREEKPGMTVEHQASTFMHPWTYGVSADLSDHNDYLQGDFYGNYVHGSIASKLFYHLSPSRPFGYETSANELLRDHTTLKNEQMLLTKVCLALANGGAFVFIDAIDPVGTLNPKVYDTLGGIFDRTTELESFLGGEMLEDVAVYLSTESKMNFADNGKFVLEPAQSVPHVDGAMRAVQALMRSHIPYGILTRKSLKELSRYKVLILPNVLMMHADEAQAFREYVANGGKLYASKWTSLVTPDGTRHDDFLLSDVFGASFERECADNFTYIAPGEALKATMEGYSSAHPLSINGTQMFVRVHADAEPMGEIVLPYTDPADLVRFASIHSNPPGNATGYPAFARHRFGEGEVIYAAGDLENNVFHMEVFARLIRDLAGTPFRFGSDAHPSLEITAFEQAEASRTVIHFLSLQDLAPPLPVPASQLQFMLEGRTVARVTSQPGYVEVPWHTVDDILHVDVPAVDIYRVLLVEYE